MVKYKKEMVEEDIPQVIICDVCKNSYNFEEDWEEAQEFHHIHFQGGYGSVFGDGVKMKADICQHCIKKLLGDALVVDEEEDSVPNGCDGNCDECPERED